MAAQVSYGNIEELEKKLSAVKEDTARANILCQLATTAWSDSPSKAIRYGQQALQVATTANDRLLQAKALNIMGVIYGYAGSYELAAEYFFKALHLRQEAGEPGLAAGTLGNIGVLYIRQGQYRQALPLFQQAESMLANFPDKTEQYAVALANISDIYNRLEIPDSTLIYLNKIYSLDSKLKNNNLKILSVIREAKARLMKQETQTALALCRKAESLAASLTNRSDENTLYRGIADIYLGIRHYPRAMLFARKAMEVATQSESLAELKAAHKQLVLVYSAMGAYKEALACTEEVNRLDDEMNSQHVKMYLQTLETHFDLTTKQRENERLYKANQQQYILIITSLAILAVALLLLLLLNRVNTSRKKALHEISLINRSLEHVVAERTRELTRRNDQLISYAYLNSHQVRGPLARLMGLVYLLRQGWWGGSTEELVGLIDVSATELDNVIREINNSLHAEEAPGGER